MTHLLLQRTGARLLWSCSPNPFPNEVMVAKKKFTSASELADMGYCEKKLLFEDRLGRRVSSERVESMQTGDAAHKAFHRDAVTCTPGLRSSETKPWCFIASELYGSNAWETAALRLCRDRLLRQCAAGRAFIGVYYRYSPGIARWLRRHRCLKKLARVLLRPLAAVLKWAFERHLRSGGAKS